MGVFVNLWKDVLFEHGAKNTLDFAVGGHNVVLCRQAGGGKSVTIKTIFKVLNEAGNNVALCVTTGIACTHFPHTFSPMTIHKWVLFCNKINYMDPSVFSG